MLIVRFTLHLVFFYFANTLTLITGDLICNKLQKKNAVQIYSKDLGPLGSQTVILIAKLNPVGHV